MGASWWNSHKVSLVDAIQSIEPDLPAALLNESASCSLKSIASRLHLAWTTFGFEVRLGADSTVDLGVSATRRPRGRGIFEDGEWASVSSSWQRLRRFDERWREPQSWISTWAPFVFLEFDSATEIDAEPAPSIFVALDSPLGDDARQPHLEAAREVADLLLEFQPDSAIAAKLAACFTMLPRSGVVLHVGAMLGRPEKALRVSAALPGDAVGAYLRRLGGYHAAEAGERAISCFPRWMRRVQIDFDLGEEIRPRVGFGVRPRERCEWPSLLADLREAGCVQPEKLEALLSWPGTTEARPQRGGAPTQFHRELSHVKLTWQPGRAWQAKAYFGAEPIG